MPDEPITIHYTPEQPLIAGRYQLVQLVGQGGMGEVWIAQQEEPVKRRVALKLILPGMDSKAVLARFEQERQALALMDHSNIAKVLDAGLTHDRRPFFAMEFVPGLPLTRFCDDKKLSIPERLELFLSICQAVQHAHQKGIVHRDLKPSNILVSMADGKPLAKVIDFGVAKATSGKLTDETLATQMGSVVGTLDYMAPEQAGVTALDVDTRADVYSLGVILYELVTGLRPFDSARLQSAAMDELFKILREEDPPRPSTRLSSSGSQESLAAARKVEARELTSLLRGDLDWVVMKCLEKDRERRYESAAALSRDVERYLRSEPVEACPPSASYRVRKFVRRNKGPVLAGSLLLAALVAGIVGTTWGLISAEKARVVAEAANDAAQRRLLQIERGTELLGSIFVELDPKAEEKEGKPLRIILGERIQRAANRLDGGDIADPLTEAKLQIWMGNSIRSLGNPGPAIALLEKALATREANLGPFHPDTLTAQNDLAFAYQDAGKADLALPLLERTLKIREEKLGPDHPNTHTSRNNLAFAYTEGGKVALAVPLYEQMLKYRSANLGHDHPDTLLSRNNLAFAYQDLRKLDLAIPLFELNLQLREAKLGDEHPFTLVSRNNLASAYQEAKQLDLAVPLFEKTLKSRAAKLGDEHPDTLQSQNNLALAYRASGKHDLAVPLFERTLRAREAKLGEDHASTNVSRNNLASAYRAAGKVALAIPLFEKSLRWNEAKLGKEHAQTTLARYIYAKACLDAGDAARAVPSFEQTLKAEEKHLGEEHPDTFFTRHLLAKAYLATDKTHDALVLLEKVYRQCHSKRSPGHKQTIAIGQTWIAALEKAGQLEKAASVRSELEAAMK